MKTAITLTLAAALDPFDCYQGNGQDYPGLAHLSESGRTCQRWSEQFPHKHDVSASDKGYGNHNYCRNPKGDKERPWCYTLDDAKEWEYCSVPKCDPAMETPEAWVAPKGLKSADAEAEGPCEPDADTRPKFTSFEITEYGKVLDPGSCKVRAADNGYLIGNEFHKADDVDACAESCLMVAGAKFATFWELGTDVFADQNGAGSPDGANCGCFRECIPNAATEGGAINKPSTVRFATAFLQKRHKRCKRAATHTAPVRPVTAQKLEHPDMAKAAQASEKLVGMMSKLGW